MQDDDRWAPNGHVHRASPFRDRPGNPGSLLTEETLETLVLLDSFHRLGGLFVFFLRGPPLVIDGQIVCLNHSKCFKILGVIQEG